MIRYFLLFLLPAFVALASDPPRVRLARSLTGDQVAHVVTNAPKGARISVPLASLSPWLSNRHYRAGDVSSHLGSIYVCVQSHDSLSTWQPPMVPALWRLVRAPSDGVIPSWRQPLGAHDAYAKGARVTYAGKVWESNISANVWAPGVYGWKIIP
jgi:chitodextrinase